MTYSKIALKLVLITCLIFTAALSLKAQSIAEVENIDFYSEDTKLIITYDIIKAGTGELFDIWIKVKTDSGKEIIPRSIYGDIGKGVTGGINKRIYWDLESDQVNLDEEITIEVFARPDYEKPPPQEVEEKEKIIKANIPEFHRDIDLGFGLGLDYGGLMGAKIEYIPLNHLGIFGVAGIQLTGFGWQFGANGYFIRKTNKKGFRVYGKGMFGTNASIFILDYDKYNKSYLGPTFGAGIQIRFGSSKKHGIDGDLNFPIRSQEFKDDWEVVKNDPMVEVQSEPLPFTISIGYHIEF
ncbi:MAG: hypothetical protein R2764_02580 [Bacteroidales bacterium]